MIYFDSAATTPPSDAAISAFKNALDCFGNPGSVHFMGVNAKKLLDLSRKTISKALSCSPTELVFTSCGSESNNQAIFGLARLRARRSKRIITTDSEHPSVSSPLSVLREQGWEIIKIPTANGVLDISSLEKELLQGCAFVSIMLVNNETGAKYDIASVRAAIDKSNSGALFHCDAVQGFLKTENRREISKYCDVASLSAHKIGGFKGVGALYVREGIKLPAFIHGGGQENGSRSGTENVCGIAAFAAACEAFSPEVVSHISRLHGCFSDLISESPYIVPHIPESHVGSILLISVPGVRSEVMLNALSAEGICVSAGSACSARKGISHAMGAFGLEKEMLESALRISFGANNTEKECVILFEKITEIAKRLKK